MSRSREPAPKFLIGFLIVDVQTEQRGREPAAEISTAPGERAMRAGSVGPYLLQAAIAAVHDEAPSAADGTAGIPERTYLLMRSARLANP